MRSLLQLIFLLPILKAVITANVGTFEINLVSFSDKGLLVVYQGDPKPSAAPTCAKLVKSGFNCKFSFDAFVNDAKGKVLDYKRSTNYQEVAGTSGNGPFNFDSFDGHNVTIKGGFEDNMVSLTVSLTHTGVILSGGSVVGDCLDCLYLVDQFVFDLSSEYPDGLMKTKTVNGSQLPSSTSLNVNYNIKCNSNFGDRCQFNKCDTQNGTAMCNSTEGVFICKVSGSQYQNCINCPSDSSITTTSSGYKCIGPGQQPIYSSSSSTNDAFEIVMIIFIIIAILEFILIVGTIIYMSYTGRNPFQKSKTRPIPIRSTDESSNFGATKPPQIRTNPTTMPNGRIITGDRPLQKSPMNDEWQPGYTTVTSTRSAPQPPAVPPGGLVSFDPRGSSEDLVITKSNGNGDSKPPAYADSVNSSQNSHPSRREVSV